MHPAAICIWPNDTYWTFSTLYICIYILSFFLSLARSHSFRSPFWTLSQKSGKNPLRSYVYRCILLRLIIITDGKRCCYGIMEIIFLSHQFDGGCCCIISHSIDIIKNVLAVLYLSTQNTAVHQQRSALQWNCKNAPDKIQLIIYECHLKK